MNSTLIEGKAKCGAKITIKSWNDKEADARRLANKISSHERTCNFCHHINFNRPITWG